MTNQFGIKDLGKGIILVSAIDKNDSTSWYTWDNLKLMECNREGI